ncbi:FecR family protein [Arenibacter nanhaiticus]|uniref:FecR family protein n=1 Tax=Arenibacter nanhaiticus TaxID=558155 RepID=A0A1M6GGN6_9FLAO|nr:FecR domain-containing protein [Arenibacter nanhaiticus]SHJ09144.1 FecR family protein [Arenibacter nanhaiticus]
MKQGQRIKHLLNKFVQNKCSPEEVAELVAYFKKEELTAEFLQVEEVLENLDIIPKMDKNTYHRIQDQILSKAEILENKTKRELYKNKNLLSYTAVAAVLIGLMVSIIYFRSFIERFYNDSQENYKAIVVKEYILLETDDGKLQELSEQGNLDLLDKKGNIIGGKKGNKLVYKKAEALTEKVNYNTIRIPYGKRFEVQLSDGSHVFLNAGSSLKYPVNFPKTGKREVTLTGEAFFKVTEDKERPFVLTTKNIQIGVLGTEFNVTAYGEDSITNVVLVEGSVKLKTGQNLQNGAILEPGQLASLELNNNSLHISEVDTEIYTSWMQGGLAFVEITFEDILKKMERHYNVKIINEDKNLAKEKFNAKFADEPLDRILNYFKETYGLEFTKENQRTIIINQKT